MVILKKRAILSGQLIQKKTGNNTVAPLQTVDYSYNIRGWLTGINDVSTIGNDLFSFDIRYDDPTGGTPLYNGNISQTGWRTNNTDNSLKNYTYAYDPLNRITTAIDNTGHYNLSNVSYDKNGNILSLNRQGPLNEIANDFGVMDELTYSYDIGNKLLTVEDTADDTFGFKDDAVNSLDNIPDYTYDANGNMISDTNKNITGISYNHLNLPVEITFNGDPNQKINYFYSADGIKQQKIVNDSGATTTTAYAGGYTYENSSLKFINQAEGYIEPDGAGGYDYVYQYKDHLGNIRLSYSDSNGDGVVETSEIREEKNYYPFGLLHRGYNNILNGTENKFLTYNGVEFEESLDLNMYEMDFRQYDPALGRFTSIDPVTHFDYSTYQAFDNNPVFWADPSGADAACNTCGEATDIYGRARYDKWGNYIPPHERVSVAKNSFIDKLAVKALKKTAKLFFGGEDVSNLTEEEKQQVFKEDELGTIGILLWEFATGTGREVRRFHVGTHPFADRLMEGRILAEIIDEFNNKARNDNYDFGKVGNSKEYKITLEFSPGKKPSSWLESLSKHFNSNASQFFVGGALAQVKIQDRNLIIQIYNETSRSSLMLHIAKNYERKNGNKPLSTIKQYINATYKLISDEKNRMNNKVYLTLIIVSNLFFTGCLNLHPCNKDILGRYYCSNINGATNYLDLNKDGSFFHYYQSGDTELFHSGTWKKSNNGYCTIELNGWKNFNEDGKNYKEFGNGILFINGNYLNIGPDGESSTSFEKEKK